MKSVSKLVILVACLAGLSGCGTSQQLKVSSQTVGQELIDLKKAYDSGALTEKEYNKQREAILDRND
jgi:uncharacterized lipoprotein